MNSTQAEATMRRVAELGPNAPNAREREHLLHMLQSQSPEFAARATHQLIVDFDRLNRALLEVRSQVDALRATHERLTKPPWLEATFCQGFPEEGQALVQLAGGRRLVTLNEGVDLESFEPGDDVLLNGDTNVLMCRCPWGSSRVGELAEFQRYVAAGRLTLRCRDDEYVVEAAGGLAREELSEGDLVLWNRETRFALERIERPVSQRYFLTEVPDVASSEIGGQRQALRALSAALSAILTAPDTAVEYGLGSGKQSILLVGPPGCGKTLLARFGASDCTRRSGRKCRFAVVKPGEWTNKYVGQTEENIRSCFHALRASAGDDYVVLFLDEVESIGRVRGDIVGHHSDKFLGALLAELDGFVARGNVAIVAATNRKELLDPAIYERLSDVEIRVPRPNMQAAKEIFQVHMAAQYPYHPNGSAAAHTRGRIINRAVSLLYHPNTDNALCVARFSDGTERTVTAGQLMSGRIIEQISRNARQRAFLRHIEQGPTGITVEDAEEAVADAIDRLSTTLSPRNIRSYLDDLPQDLNVVSVKPVARRACRTHRYLANPTQQEP